MKKFLGHECHNEEHNEECFYDLNGVLCIQDSALRQQLNNYRCVPFMYFNNSTLVMEPISDLARQKANAMDVDNRKDVSQFESNLLEKDRNILVPVTIENDMGYKGKMPSRRKIKGPNPLSCKSKKIAKRTRRKAKIA